VSRFNHNLRAAHDYVTYVLDDIDDIGSYVTSDEESDLLNAQTALHDIIQRIRQENK
jgi:hypothetical protein